MIDFSQAIFFIVPILLLGRIIISVKNNPVKWATEFHLLPITVFIFWVNMNVADAMVWKQAFIISGIVALGSIILQRYQRIIIDRLYLGLNLYLFISGLAFLLHITPILQVISTYKTLSIMLSVFVVGLMATLLSPEGFIGVRSYNQALVRAQSLKLLAAAGVSVVAAYFLRDYGTFIAVGIPFAALAMFKQELVKQF